MPAVSVLSTTSTEIVAEDFARSMVLITNSSATANCHVAFGAAATTSDAYIGPGGNMTVVVGDSRCKCAINGLSSSGTITVKYSKLSASY